MAARFTRRVASALAGLATMAHLTTPARSQEADLLTNSPARQEAVDTTGALQVVDVAQGVSVTQRGRGSLLVVADSWDFGFVPQDAEVSHRYMLENSGDDTLFVEEVKPTCGCTVAHLPAKTLAPGARVPVDITLSTKKFSGHVAKQVHVVSSDARSPKYALKFTAQVGPAPEVGLDSGAVIRIAGSSDPTRSVARLPLTNLSGAPVRLRIADLSPDFLSASFSKQTLAPEQSAELVVESRQRPESAPLSGSVTIELSGAQEVRLTFPVTGNWPAK